MKKGYIYKIISPSDKIYIGQTTNLKLRKRKYKNNGNKSQTMIYNSIKKYGYENHKFEILETFYSDNFLNEILNASEIYWIGFYDSYRNGMNLTRGGGGCKGVKFSEETKQKLSKKSKGRKHSEEAKCKISKANKGKVAKNKGSKLSNKQKQFISQKNTGRKFTKESILKRQETREQNAKIRGFYYNPIKGNGKRGENKKKFIRQYKNDIIVGEYDSMTNAANSLNSSPRAFSIGLKRNPLYKGFKWEIQN